MRRASFGDVSRFLPAGSSTRHTAGVIAAIAALALAIGIVLGAGSSRGANTPVKGTGTATVERRDLVATDTEAGTLSYASPQTVFNRMSGTVTWLPSVGQVVKPGGTLYKVDGAPVVLFDGSMPAYRDLSAGVTDGFDVQELKSNLSRLGYQPGTVNQTFDSTTTAAVERWQAAMGMNQTGTVSLGQAVFLPSAQRITSVNTALGSNGQVTSSGSAGASSGGSGASSSGSASSSGGGGSGGSSSGSSGGSSGSSNSSGSSSSSSSSSSSRSSSAPYSAAPQTQFVRLTYALPSNSSSDTPANAPACPNGVWTTTPNQKRICSSARAKGNNAQTLAALVALLKAETKELKQSRSSGSQGASRGSAGGGSPSAAAGGAGGGGRGGAAASGASAGGRASGGGSAAGGATSGGGGGSAGGAAGAGGATAQPIIQTTSTQLVVTVNLDATKQTEAVVGGPVTVQLPSGSTSNGKITQVSPVAQASSGSSSSSSGGAGGGSSTPSATVPVTITLKGRRINGLDQAAVSVNFEQQVQRNVLAVPVTALLATAGGGYALQQAAPPHRLVSVSTGLFAAGYVQVSGAQVFSGMQVTNSQG